MATSGCFFLMANTYGISVIEGIMFFILDQKNAKFVFAITAVWCLKFCLFVNKEIYVKHNVVFNTMRLK